jgi:hypothetical protein
MPQVSDRRRAPKRRVAAAPQTGAAIEARGSFQPPAFGPFGLGVVTSAHWTTARSAARTDRRDGRERTTGKAELEERAWLWELARARLYKRRHPVPTAAPSITFVLGAARSGTTLLYKALCLHPDAAYFNNYLRRLPGHPSAGIANRLARRTPGVRRRVWFEGGSNAYVYSRRRSVMTRLYPMPVGGEPAFARCGLGEFEVEQHVTPEQARALRRAAAGVQWWGGGSCFVNKRIANLRHIHLLAEAFPSARFVDITRDGRPVAVSLSKVDWWEGSVVWWYGGTPQAWRDQGRDAWELCSRNWVEEVRAIDSGLAQLDPGRVLRVTYEELVADPVHIIHHVAEFAGLSDHPGWRAEIGRLRVNNRNDSWRERLSPEAVERIEAVQAEELRRRGYL